MKNNKGITLLVLIITVVILALLTLITINLALHKDTITKVRETDNEITSKMENGEEQTESLKNEYNQMDNAIDSWNNAQGVEYENLISSVKSKTTSSITVETLLADENLNNSVEYELWLSDRKNGEYAKVATSTAATSNTAVELTAMSLTKYTDYYWYVIAKCGNSSTTIPETKVKTKTYCPGTGYMCSGTTTSTCTNCSGTGEITVECPGSTSSETCTNCSGTGKVVCGKTLTSGGTYSSGTGNTCYKCGNWLSYRTCNGSGHSSTYVYCSNTSCSQYQDPPTTCTYKITCPNCTNGVIPIPCTAHSSIEPHTVTETCNICKGEKTITKSPCIHNLSVEHEYCEHNKTYQHDK